MTSFSIDREKMIIRLFGVTAPVSPMAVVKKLLNSEKVKRASYVRVRASFAVMLFHEGFIRSNQLEEARDLESALILFGFFRGSINLHICSDESLEFDVMVYDAGGTLLCWSEDL